MEREEMQRALTAILFAAGEPVAVSRLAQTLQADPDEIHQGAKALMDELSFSRSGVRVVRLDEAYQMCSSPEYADLVAATLETRKPPKLSPSQLETLTVIAYYQPATKAYIEQIRGVDSSYSVSALLTKRLICEAGRLNVPGRPILYETTPDFLRVFGLQSLEELPEIERVDIGAGKEQLRMDQTASQTATEDGTARQASDGQQTIDLGEQKL